MIITKLHMGGQLGWRRRRALSLLLIADPPCLGLQFTNLTEVEPHCPGTEWVSLRLAAVFFEGGTEAADECIKAAPGLAEGAWAWRRGIWVAVEGAHLGVDFGLAELVEVPEEFEDVCAAATGER